MELEINELLGGYLVRVNRFSPESSPHNLQP